MIRIETEIDIATAPHEVWRVLVAFEDYGAWNPFITKIDGPASVGSAITVHVHIVGQANLPVPAKVTTVEPDRELVWHSHLVVPGVLDRDHILRIEPNATGCIVHNIQTFEGPIARTASMLSESSVRQGLTRMNDALKRRVEQTGTN